MDPASISSGRVSGRSVAAMFAIALAVIAAQVVSESCSRGAAAPAGPALFTYISAEPAFDFSEARPPGDGEWVAPWRAFACGSGWSEFERWGAWTVGSASHLSFVLPSGGPRRLVVEAHPFVGLVDADLRQSVEVVANGVPCGAFDLLVRGPAEHSVGIPDGALRQGVNHIELRYSHSMSPGEAGLSQDHRQLAIGVHRAALVAEHNGDRPWAPRLSITDDGRSLTIRRDGRLVFPLPPSFTGPSLPIEYQFSSEARGGSVRAGLATMGEDGSVVRTGGDVTVAAEVDPSGILRARRPSGGTADILVLDVAVGSMGGSVGLSMPWATSAEEAPAEPTRNGRKPGSRDRRRVPPDVVVIILDAARADHFGTYGYHRDTTPFIDSLAQDGLAFTRTFAIAPYTLCSVPTMLTGTSWAVHGVVERGLRLSDEAETLAESLKKAGYRTLGFSATPNNSSSLGDAQGYDEFHELWNQLPPNQAINPFVMSKMVAERIEAGLGDAPVHLMLHFVPPHAPYTPAERYDLFTDPTYRGPVDGSERVVSAIVAGRLETDAADRRNLVDLYDGNLRMADEAVRRVLTALRRSGRLQNAVVIITSDHGEAFFEHGRQGHNTTVYDEMMHVPFIVSLPEAVDPPAVDLHQLASLEDLVPTVQGMLGLPSDPSVTGIDLLAPPSGSPDAQGRTLLFRSAAPKIYALRGPRWKVVMSQSGRHQELYDLASDPKEANNVALERPLTMSVLSSRLVRRIAAVEPWLARPSDDLPDQDDQEALRALGYVE